MRILLAREWAQGKTTPAQVAEDFALIQAIQAKKLNNGALKSAVVTLPKPVREHLQTVTRGDWSRFNTLTASDWQAVTK